MSFETKKHIFSYNFKDANTLASQRSIIRLNLKELIPNDGCSPLVAIETVKIKVYDKDCNIVPVKFSVLNATLNKSLTQDPCVVSCTWSPDPNLLLKRTKVAGTELSPYKRTLTVTEEENRQAILNVLAFMMSANMQERMASKSCLEEVTGPSDLRTTEFQCAECRRLRTASVKEDLQFSMPCCHDGLICTPMQCKDSLQKLAVVTRMAMVDTVDTTDTMPVLRLAAKQLYPDCIFRKSNQGVLLFHYKIMTFLTSLYSTLGEIAGTFFVLDEKHSHVNLLLESPKEKLLSVTGELTMTLLYGPDLRSIYTELNTEESAYMTEHVGVQQMTPDVIIKTVPLSFFTESDGSLNDWFNTLYV